VFNDCEWNTVNNKLCHTSRIKWPFTNLWYHLLFHLKNSLNITQSLTFHTNIFSGVNRGCSNPRGYLETPPVFQQPLIVLLDPHQGENKEGQSIKWRHLVLGQNLGRFLVGAAARTRLDHFSCRILFTTEPL